MAISLSALGIPPGLSSLIQTNTLQRKFYDALFPALLYRADTTPEMWAANLGEKMVMTRTGLIPVALQPLIPGSDPVSQAYATEQWTVEANQYAGLVNTNMPSSYVSLASIFLRNTHQLGLQAGQTVNRLARNKMFVAYDSGEANALGAVGAGGTAVPVSTVDGFTEQIVNGRIEPVSAANPVRVSFSTPGEPDNFVISATPSDPKQPAGLGVLTLSAPLVVGVAARDTVLSENRARRVRAGGGVSVDAITAADTLTLQDCISAVSRMRAQRVPPHPDGWYHAHITPAGEAQIFQDNAWQRLFQSLPGATEYREFLVNEQVGIRFYRNTESPTASTVSTVVKTGANALMAPEIGAEVVNDLGVPIDRMLVTGGGVCYEKWIDEAKYITTAGVTGKIGNFAITNNGLMVMTDRIRFIVRAPLDALQQNVTQAWSYSGDWGVPSDQTSGDAARFKRAVVVEHAGAL